MERTYEQQCQSAAEAQGLKPYMDALTAMGREFDLWQTGGFQMVLAIPTATANRAEQSGIFVTIGCDCVSVTDVDEWICALCAMSAHISCDHSWEMFEDAKEIHAQIKWITTMADAAALMADHTAAQIGAK